MNWRFPFLAFFLRLILLVRRSFPPNGHMNILWHPLQANQVEFVASLLFHTQWANMQKFSFLISHSTLCSFFLSLTICALSFRLTLDFIVGIFCYCFVCNNKNTKFAFVIEYFVWAAFRCEWQVVSHTLKLPGQQWRPWWKRSLNRKTN